MRIRVNPTYAHAADLPKPVPNTGTADFQAADALKRPLLTKAAKKLLSDENCADLRFQLEQFKEDNPWVLESALFDCLKREESRQDVAWWDWEAKIRDRDAATLTALRKKHAADINIFIAVQLLFDRQWKSLKVRQPEFAQCRCMRMPVIHPPSGCRACIVHQTVQNVLSSGRIHIRAERQIKFQADRRKLTVG
jgi:4-alpha-glucanotransferase